MSSTAIDAAELDHQGVRRRLSQDVTAKPAQKLQIEKTMPTVSTSNTSEPFKDIKWSTVAQSFLIDAFKALLFFSAITMLMRGLPWAYELLPEHVELDSVIQGLWTLGMLAEAAVSNIFWLLFKATGAASNCLWSLSDVVSTLLNPLAFIPGRTARTRLA